MLNSHLETRLPQNGTWLYTAVVQWSQGTKALNPVEPICNSRRETYALASLVTSAATGLGIGDAISGGMTTTRYSVKAEDVRPSACAITVQAKRPSLSLLECVVPLA